MTEAAKYSALEHLRDGRQIEIHALTLADEEAMLAAIDRTGASSLYRQFFWRKRHFSDKEKAFFLNVDFVSHVALVAVAQEDGSNCHRRRRDDTSSSGLARLKLAFAVIYDHRGRASARL